MVVAMAVLVFIPCPNAPYHLLVPSHAWPAKVGQLGSPRPRTAHIKAFHVAGTRDPPT
jgi:hypothetical protein